MAAHPGDGPNGRYPLGMRRSIVRPLFRFFAAAISAMLLFEGSAYAASAEPLTPNPVPGNPGRLPTAPAFRPAEPACRVTDNAAMADYLSGRACPPEGFPYQPEILEVPGGVRLADPKGSCSSGALPSTTDDYDFATACRTHDYGYDLLRYLGLGGGRRRAVDLFFLEDMKTDCVDRAEEAKEHCLTAADLVHRAIKTSSRIRSYSTPWGTLRA